MRQVESIDTNGKSYSRIFGSELAMRYKEDSFLAGHRIDMLSVTLD